MQKSFHVQPYPLWALWSHESEVEYLGRVVGWVSLLGGGKDPDWTYPVVYLADTGTTENLHSEEYDLFDRPELVIERNGWTAEQVVKGAKRT